MKTFSLVLFLFTTGSALAEDGGLRGSHESEASWEGLLSDDIQLRSYSLRHTSTFGKWMIEAGIGQSEYALDYVPVLFGFDSELREETVLYNAGLSRQWNESWTTALKFRGYEGFADYRSIWIAEFYKQFFGAFDGYYSPEPRGYAFGLTTKWDYQPGAGFVSLSLDYGRDEIAPGWSFNPFIGAPEADKEVLHTISANLRLEQAVTGWLKTEAEVYVRKITDREPRFGIRHSWAAAAGPVALRLTGGYTEESPSFEALYGSAVLEWKMTKQWLFHVGYRVYEDTGEIQAAGFNALAPAVRTSELFAGLLWERSNISVSLGVGRLKTDYDPLSEDNEFFGNLYRDRDWMTFRAAVSVKF